MAAGEGRGGEGMGNVEHMMYIRGFEYSVLNEVLVIKCKTERNSYLIFTRPNLSYPILSQLNPAQLRRSN